ncbi:MAG TPA: hypothetical protein PKB06_12605, partial [Actinotalea sp.]|nr:hypothetical protein [Actinotalea sp.]
AGLKDAARLVLREAAAGDGVAARIVREQVDGLVGYAAVAAARSGWSPQDEVPVLLGGSLLTSEVPVLREALLGGLRALWPAA